MNTNLIEMKKPMLFMSSFPSGDIRLVDVLGENKNIKGGIYIRYAEGGTDTTTERFLFEIPPQLNAEATKVAAIEEFNEVLIKSIKPIFQPHIEGVLSVVKDRINRAQTEQST